MTKNTLMHQNLLDYTSLGPVAQSADNAIQRKSVGKTYCVIHQLEVHPSITLSSQSTTGAGTQILSFFGLAFKLVSNNQRTTRTDYRKKDWATLAYPCGVKEPTKIWHAPIMWLKNSFSSCSN